MCTNIWKKKYKIRQLPFLHTNVIIDLDTVHISMDTKTKG